MLLGSYLSVVVNQFALGDNFLIPLGEIGLLSDSDATGERHYRALRSLLAIFLGRGGRHSSVKR